MFPLFVADIMLLLLTNYLDLQRRYDVGNGNDIVIVCVLELFYVDRKNDEPTAMMTTTSRPATAAGV